MRAAWARLHRAWERFGRIDGTLWAGSLAYSAFVSLFPMLLLFITAASFFVERDRAGRAAVAFIEVYVPLTDPTRRLILATISGLVASRARAGAAALLVLVWSAGQCFGTLVGAVNRAWDLPPEDWWRLPLKSLALLGMSAVAASVVMAASALERLTFRFLPGWTTAAVDPLLSFSVEFLGLALFYRFAPRNDVRFAGVWNAALIAAIGQRAAENGFVVYLQRFAGSNAVYGAFGGVTALLLWIYVAGFIFIFGACLCAERAR